MTKNKIVPGTGSGKARKGKKKLGVDSVEASALLMSEGYTKDPIEALNYEAEQTEIFDAEMRAKLRESMGFDFKVKMQGNKLVVYSKPVKNRVKVHTFVLPADLDEYGNIISPALINRLVDACIELKAKWDEKHEGVGV